RTRPQLLRKAGPLPADRSRSLRRRVHRKQLPRRRQSSVSTSLKLRSFRGGGREFPAETLRQAKEPRLQPARSRRGAHRSTGKETPPPANRSQELSERQTPRGAGGEWATARPGTPPPRLP